MFYFLIVFQLLRINKQFILFTKTGFVRVNSDDHLCICLLWSQILVLKLSPPKNPNIWLYMLLYGTTQVDFPITWKIYESFEKGSI